MRRCRLADSTLRGDSVAIFHVLENGWITPIFATDTHLMSDQLPPLDPKLRVEILEYAVLLIGLGKAMKRCR